jgi:hypothetical protein
MRKLIIADLAAGQSTISSLAQRIGLPAAQIEPIIKDMLVDQEIEKRIIADFLPVYRLAANTLQDYHK